MYYLNDTDLVIAARAGDREALDQLARRYLPMVYNFVRRAMDGDAHTDDVVQETMLHAVRQLPELRDPPFFRLWLARIAMHQITTHRSRERAVSGRMSRLDEAVGRPDPAAEIEGPTLLRAELAGQRRQIQHASRWLTEQDRTLMSLWYLEAVGQLTRNDVAVVLGVRATHATVRMQRMRDQLELSRAVVAALEAAPGCDVLDGVVEHWDGVPSPFWRKRIGRHVRSCARCRQATGGRVPAERLFAGIAMLPIPVALATAVITRSALAGKATATAATVWPAASTAGAKGWILSHLPGVAAAHPVAYLVVAGTLALGATGWSTVAPQWFSSGRSSVGAPAASAPLALGGMSLEAANATGQFITASGTQAALAPVGESGPARRRATFEAVRGLADPACFSFRTADGRYLRHASWRLQASRDDGAALFRGDATFCGRPGPTAGTVALESSNYPGRFLRHVGGSLFVRPDDGSSAFAADSSFLIRGPLG